MSCTHTESTLDYNRKEGDIILLNQRVDIQEKIENRTALGVEKEWVTVETRYALILELDTKGQHQHQQIQHTEITNTIVFRGPVSIKLNNRIRCKDQYYQPLAPPKNTDRTNRYVSLPVKQVPQ